MFCLIHTIIRSGVSALLLFLCAWPAWATTASGMGQPTATSSHPASSGALSSGVLSSGVLSSGVLSSAPKAVAPHPVGASAKKQTPARSAATSHSGKKNQKVPSQRGQHGPVSSAPRPMDGAAMYRVGQEKNLCALTFDDGPGPHTARLLDILAERGIRATFFVLGDRAARYPELIRRMVEEGHEVANHTYSHKNLRQLPEQAQAAEIGQVQALLQAQGVTSRYLRPPFGRYDAVTLRLAAAMGLEVALWSVDSNDWQRQVDVDSMQSVYGRPARNGIILFHDTHQPTVNTMDLVLDGLEAGQCRFVTVSEFMIEARNPVPAMPESPVIPEHPARLPSPELPETPVRSVQGLDGVASNATQPPHATQPNHADSAKNASEETVTPNATSSTGTTGATGATSSTGTTGATGAVGSQQSANPTNPAGPANSASPLGFKRPEWLPSVIGTFRSWARGVLSDSSAHSTP